MTQPWSTPQDILDRWLGQNKPSIQDDAEFLATLIGDIEDEILRRVPSVPSRIESGELPLRRVIRVTAAAIQRAWSIAGDYRTYSSEMVGPFSSSSSYSQNLARALELTEDEVSKLQPAVKSRATSLNMIGRQEWVSTGNVRPVRGSNGTVFYTNVKRVFPRIEVWGDCE